ncbi:USPL1 isopeptidase, partial [Erpornis zantholeuca]|nr:USPL1 isopeptidase [Erpornis zantholeuca]
MDTQKTTNGLQVIGEGTGIGKSTLHMVGYLGKNCNPVEATAHDYCPVCKQKGQIQGLRTYRLNFQESIFLCENPQCIYPLGYKPLNSIITSTGSENHQVPSTHKKRKLGDTSDFPAVESDPKKARTKNVVNAEHTINADSVVKCYQNSLCIPKASQHDVLQNDQQNPGNRVGSCMPKVDFETTKTNNYQESQPKTSSPKTQLLPNSELLSTASEISLKEDKGSTNNRDLCLQWRNIHNLSWLDCILSALVHLETLKFALAEEYNNGKCLLQKLLTKYNQASILLNTSKRSTDGLPKAESHLNEIRNVMFTQLQPHLRCKLGDVENPVFALQQLLHLDQQAEKLFLHSFSWKLECVCCGHKNQDRLEKTLTTFTNIIPDWHPLNAIHIGPCNNCGDASQRQQMILEKVPSILMLHFVEGLPHNNLEKYSFQFEEDTYQITSIVQYRTDKKHFISWSLNPDGTWLECDDLKGPYCKRHKRFEVPPSEIHIVIWEKKASRVPQELNSQFHSKNSEDFPLKNVQSNSTVLHCGFNNTVGKTPAEHHKEDSVRTPEKKQERIAEDESIVHHGLENLADGDLVTLMLEEVLVDSEDKSLPNGQMMGNNLVDGWGTPQRQESAFSLSTPYPGEFVGTRPAVNNKSMLYENSSMCLPLEDLNAVNITPPMPNKHDPDSSDPLPSQTNDRTNIANREHGLNSKLLLNKKLLAVENTVQKPPDLKDAGKTVLNSPAGSSSGANNSVQPSHKDKKGGFVGSWVKKLLSKNTSFMLSTASAVKNERSCKTPSAQKIREVRLPTKGASNFGGFQSRSTKKTTETLKLLAPQSNNTHPSSNFKGFSQSTCLPTANHTTIAGPMWNKSGSTLGTSGKVTQFPSPGSNSGKAEESDSDKTKKLRLKLLKKLNAKKKKLASLDRIAVEQIKQEKPVSGDISTPSQTESQNDSELLQSFLRELQYQIDVAGKESEFNANPVPGCTGHNNTDEILAELLSPTATVASLEAPRSEDECMYMEMVDSSVATTVATENTSVPQAAVTSEDHNYYSPVKDTNLELDAINKHSGKKLSFESPTRDDILEDLFCISAPSSMAGDIDLPHFDETLFET